MTSSGWSKASATRATQPVAGAVVASAQISGRRHLRARGAGRRAGARHRRTVPSSLTVTPASGPGTVGGGHRSRSPARERRARRDDLLAHTARGSAEELGHDLAPRHRAAAHDRQVLDVDEHRA